MSTLDTSGTKLQIVSPALDDRPFLELAQGLDGFYQRLQPGTPDDRSPGDIIADLVRPYRPIGNQAVPGKAGDGFIADGIRWMLEILEKALKWLENALEKLEEWLVQPDLVLALGGVIVPILHGTIEATAAIASLGADLVKQPDKPGQLLADMQKAFPDLSAEYLKLEKKAAIIPPPEDVEIARVAIARVLEPKPTDGTRSLPSLRAAIKV